MFNLEANLELYYTNSIMCLIGQYLQIEPCCFKPSIKVSIVIFTDIEIAPPTHTRHRYPLIAAISAFRIDEPAAPMTVLCERQAKRISKWPPCAPSRTRPTLTV